MNKVAQMMLNQLKVKNPKAFQQFESFMSNKGDPQQLLKQVHLLKTQIKNSFNKYKTRYAKLINIKLRPTSSSLHLA